MAVERKGCDDFALFLRAFAEEAKGILNDPQLLNHLKPFLEQQKRMASKRRMGNDWYLVYDEDSITLLQAG